MAPSSFDPFSIAMPIASKNLNIKVNRIANESVEFPNFHTAMLQKKIEQTTRRNKTIGQYTITKDRQAERNNERKKERISAFEGSLEARGSAVHHWHVEVPLEVDGVDRF